MFSDRREARKPQAKLQNPEERVKAGCGVEDLIRPAQDG